jgi:hypothetical protein
MDRIDRAIKSSKFVCTTPSLSVEAVQKQFSRMPVGEDENDDQAASKKTSTITMLFLTIKNKIY